MSREADDLIIAQAKTILNRRVRRGSALTSPDATRDYLIVTLSPSEQEIFYVIYLTNQHHVIDKKEMFRGTIDGASVYPREVVKEALKLNAGAVVIAHNHPSGVNEPSQSDKMITERLKQALSLIDVKVLDHFICSGGESYSFAEHALI